MHQSDFIEVYPNVLSKEDCAFLVQRFEESRSSVPGKVGGGVLTELKNSQDIPITGNSSWREVEDRLNTAALNGFMAYLRKYPYALISPLMLRIQDEKTGGERRLVAEDFESMSDTQLGAMARAMFRAGSINLQRYTANEGGYPYWHCELFPKDALCDTLHRAVLWTIYLNDEFDQGETEFLYQDKKIKPKAGSLLIAPTAFTHTHRGNMPINGDKYIATSWILYQRAEVLYGAK